MKLTEFLLARRAEGVARQRAKFLEGVDAHLLEKAGAEWDRTLFGQFKQLDLARTAVGYSLLASLPFGLGLGPLRRRALPFADHPDYRQEWRP